MKRLFLIYILAFFVVTACDDDLKIVPKSSLSVNGFYKNEEDAKSAVNGMYAQMRSVANGMYQYGEWRSDHTEQTDLGTGSDIIRNTLRSDLSASDWGNFYRLINDANLIIRFTPEIDFVSEDDQNLVLAQAYFVRAWTYFQIVRIWGDAPLLLEGFISPDQEGIVPDQRDPASDIYAQIKSDVQAAIDKFPTDDINNRYAASRPAANTLKAEVYLWTAKTQGGGTGDLNTALSAINEVFGHKDLSVVPFTDLFRTTSATGGDIFSLYRDELEGGNFWTTNYMLQIQNYTALSPEEMSRIPRMETGVRFYAPTALLRDQFAENSALGNGQEDFREGITVQSYDLEIISGTDTTVLVREHLVKFIGDPGPDGRRYTDDNKIYRYADVTLMRAEILNALGNTAQAVSDLNITRNRAGIGDYAGNMTQSDVDNAILLERSVEFAFESRRFFDLVRFNRAYSDIPDLVGRENDQPILWPISDETIAENPKLKQTPGY